MDTRAHTFHDRRAAILPRAVRAGTLLLAIGLAACGGGNNGNGEPEPPNPTQTYTVNATSGAGGQIAPATRTVDAGATASFTLTPDAGYHLDAVSGCGGSLAGTTYTTAAVNADCTVTASFAADPVAITYTVTGTSGAGGQIAPATQTVADRAPREDVGQPLDVGARDDLLATLMALAEAVDQLGPQDVDLAVQDATAVGDVDLLLGELLDEVLELLVRE